MAEHSLFAGLVEIGNVKHEKAVLSDRNAIKGGVSFRRIVGQHAAGNLRVGHCARCRVGRRRTRHINDGVDRVLGGAFGFSVGDNKT